MSGMQAPPHRQAGRKKKQKTRKNAGFPLDEWKKT
jgi:hypothetical protein